MKRIQWILALSLVLSLLFPFASVFAIDEPMPELTKATVLRRAGTVTYVEGCSLYDNVWVNGYRDLINVDLEYAIMATGDEFTQKLTMAIASNSLPNLLYLPMKEYRQLAKAGMLWDLGPVINQYANEITLKNFASDGGDLLESAKIDGVQYAIPVGNSLNCPSTFLWIREDWLKNLNLEAPKTLEDVVAIARAFVNDDPDGNGTADTYGLGLNKSMAAVSNIGTIESVLNAFGGSCLYNAWVPDSEGNVSYMGISKGTRDGLEKLAAMFAEGLINTEFGVTESDTLGEAVASGKLGLFYGGENLPWNFGRDAMVNVEGCEWLVLNAPDIDGGNANVIGYKTLNYVYAVNKDYEHPEVLLKLINFFNNRINNPDADDALLAEWGVDPDTGINKCAYAYGIVDPYSSKSIGYHRTITQALAGELDPNELMPEAKRYYSPIKRFYDEGYAENGGYNPDDLTAWQYYMIHGHEGSWARYIELIDNDNFTMSVYYGSPTETMVSKWSVLQAMQEETFSKIIAGSEPIEAFDSFVESWKKLGGDKITEEINAQF